jgi:hypothetical protein
VCCLLTGLGLGTSRLFFNFLGVGFTFVLYPAFDMTPVYLLIIDTSPFSSLTLPFPCFPGLDHLSALFCHPQILQILLDTISTSDYPGKWPTIQPTPVFPFSKNLEHLEYKQNLVLSYILYHWISPNALLCPKTVRYGFLVVSRSMVSKSSYISKSLLLFYYHIIIVQRGTLWHLQKFL